MVGSYAPDALAAAREAFDSSAAVKAFYDIDTPITVAALRDRGATDDLTREFVPEFDLYLSFTGGPMLRELEDVFGARKAAPMYCSFDPQTYHPRPASKRYRADMSYMGTYAPDRQPKIEELFNEPARRLPERSFLLAGPQYPKGTRWPKNVRRIMHLNPRWHPLFYSSSRMTLNVTRRDMVQAGYSPSVRLFEAAACGAVIVSDNWPGLDTFLVPGKEVLLPASPDDVVRYLRDADDAALRHIGMAAHERMMAEHTADHRARQLESLVEAAQSHEPAAISMQTSVAV
jgi:spore maturation protein CgeB